MDHLIKTNSRKEPFLILPRPEIRSDSARNGISDQMKASVNENELKCLIEPSVFHFMVNDIAISVDHEHADRQRQSIGKNVSKKSGCVLAFVVSHPASLEHKVTNPMGDQNADEKRNERHDDSPEGHQNDTNYYDLE